MYKKLKSILENYCINRKSFEIDAIEKKLIEGIGGYSSYIRLGGYEAFYHAIMKLKEEAMIQEMKTVNYNGKKPPLKIKWNIIKGVMAGKWEDNEILRLSDLLDFTTYLKRPELQTKKEWEHILKIYNFLKERDQREYATLEERALELFNDEKFLKNNKNKSNNEIIKRLNLTLEDLKIKKYGEMFIYWNRGVKNIKNVVILENYSTFYSYKRTVEENREVFGFYPDGIIFGGGKKIIKSFSFIEELSNIDSLKALYFGDIDPEGFMIYHSLKKRYPHIEIELQIDAYNALLEFQDYSIPCIGQRKNLDTLSFIIEEFRKKGFEKQGEIIEELWNADKRLPQEFITYEYLKREKGDING